MEHGSSQFGGAVAQASEAGQPTWHRRCDSGACVEIAVQGETVMMRSSGSPETVLILARAEWLQFLAGAKTGMFDSL
jgi:hypothetical protein